MRKRFGSIIAALLASSAPVLAAEEPAGDTVRLQTSALSEANLNSANLAGAYGRLRPFYGRLRPFDISGFWAGTSAFSTTDAGLVEFWGRLRPFWGRIRGFWDGADGGAGLSPLWGRIRGFWGDGVVDSYELPQLQTDLDKFVAESRLFWEPQMQAVNGNSYSFDSFFGEFVQRMQDRHGLQFAGSGATLNAELMRGWSEEDRAKFIVEWYDGLMAFSGSDQVDHWMKTARWTPAITEQQGKGADAVIGLLDSVVTGDSDLLKKIAYQAGNGSFSDGHGAAVLSLLVSSHDGRGVMGIAPNAKVAAYNPFDATGTASWDEVANGVKALSRAGAHVINLSLGVPGYTLHPEWNSVLSTSDAVKAVAGNNVALVFAAGNEGVTQQGNIQWAFNKNPAFIVVGSVDPVGTLSSFSNRPGAVCLMQGTTCTEKLSNRFIVAPGELILVSDDKGGVVRHSGTSFAAPLVAGTIALLHDRWPWLKRFPKEATDIILQSATPIQGSTPEETGRGLLNIEASQSPLSFNNLAYYEHVGGTVSSKKNANQILKAGVQEATWEANGVYFTAFEVIGNTQRDFAIPLSSKLADQTLVLNGSQERFQNYIRSRFVDWMKKGGSSVSGQVGFTAPVANGFGWNLTMGLLPTMGYRRGENSAPHLSLRLATPSDQVSINFGRGQGASALTARTGLTLEDFDVHYGGVEPILGYASGDAYGSVELALSGAVQVTAGLTRKDVRHTSEDDGSPVNRQLLSALGDYVADAAHIRVKYTASDALTLSAAYTDLREKTGLLGVQSVDRADLSGGTRSRSASLGTDFRFGSGLSLSTSASLSLTGSRAQQNLRVAEGGLRGTAFHFSLFKQGLFSSSDGARLSLSQPFFIEDGTLEYTHIKVIDRETGEIGPVTERFSISGAKRPFVAEALYGTPFLNGAAEMSAFGRAERQAESRGGGREYIAGARASFRF